MSVYTRCFLILLAVVLATAFDEREQLEQDDIIEAVNNAQTTWKAGRNFHESLKKSYVKHLMGLKIRPEGSRLPILVDNEEEDLELPESFDAREKWSTCTSLQEIRDQGPCGSCWAVAAAAALTDRICIATDAAWNGHLSGEDILSCCCCCAVSCGQGCKGGYDDAAWTYFMTNGICTGGDYKSNEGCQPYTLPTCEHHVSGKRKNCSTYGDVPTPKCQKDCYNKRYKDHTKPEDIHKARDIFSFGGNIKAIQKELIKNGPVEAGFYVYDDFLSYKSGVYQHVAGTMVAGHAVKIIGWGVENGTEYWLAANSWNTDWGDEGFFKIKKGSDECGIERSMQAGHVDKSQYY